MARQSVLRYLIAGLLAASRTFASPQLAARDLWTVNIDNEPAPPPAKRPPFSRGARYDTSFLKYQIPGVIGAYVGFILILWFLLLTFGKRLRRAAQSSRDSLAMEMVKPLKRTLDPSPVSPSGSHTFWRWGSRSQKADSPDQPSIGSFDDKVIEHDRVRREEEMERLYAAVMSKDAHAPRPIPIPVSRDYEVPAIRSPTHARRPTSSKSFSQPQPPHIRPAATEGTYQAQSPGPALAEAVYQPPGRRTNLAFSHSQLEQQSPRQPISSPRQTLPSNPAFSRVQSPSYSHSRQGSGGSSKSRSGRASVRNLQISAPIPLPAIPNSLGYESEMAATPLSPHYIPSNPPRPPSPPASSRPHTPFEEEYNEDGDSLPDDRAAGDKDFRDSIIHAYGGDDVDMGDQSQPPQIQQRSVPNLTIATSRSATGAASSSLPLRQQPRVTGQVGTTNNPLPFRAFHPPPPTSPTSPAQTSGAPPTQFTSPGPTKTTFLSPRRDNFLPGGMNPIGPGGLPNSAALLSAGLATPYSPYMPLSPMTPVTPRLPNRRETRARGREGGRTVATAEDRVQDDKDMWGEGWD